MSEVSLWSEMLGVEKTVIEGVEFDEDEQVLVARVRPVKRERGRCGVCRRRSPVTTGVLVGGGGGRWIWARFELSWGVTRRG